MTFTVEWADPASAEAVSLWLANFPLRAGIEAAARWDIDAELATDAHLKGTPVDNCRFIVVGPLAVLYSVDVGRRVARVLELSISASARP
ncbi:MAG: hypothetical protein K2W96_13240 [Gemmataceae bacterium]|nr:hypothetical protein [Gemmataceae bacterium]